MVKGNRGGNTVPFLDSACLAGLFFARKKVVYLLAFRVRAASHRCMDFMGCWIFRLAGYLQGALT